MTTYDGRLGGITHLSAEYVRKQIGISDVEWENCQQAMFKETSPPPISVSSTPSIARVHQNKFLTFEGWELIKEHKPEMAFAMLRRSFSIMEYNTPLKVPQQWLENNCVGFFFILHDERTVLFETDEDAVLFKLNFEGRSTEELF